MRRRNDRGIAASTAHRTYFRDAATTVCFHLIFSSSSTVYGNNKSPFTEKDSIGINISNPYGKTKYMIEEILMDLSNSNPLWKIVSLRYFNPVGNHSSGILGDDSPKPTNLMK